VVSETPVSEPKTFPCLPLAMAGQRYIYHLNPLDDMTVVESVQVMSFFMLGPQAASGMVTPDVLDEVFMSMPEGARRHFAVKERSQIAGPDGELLS
jgi:hypothetical protein